MRISCYINFKNDLLGNTRLRKWKDAFTREGTWTGAIWLFSIRRIFDSIRLRYCSICIKFCSKSCCLHTPTVMTDSLGTTSVWTATKSYQMDNACHGGFTLLAFSIDCIGVYKRHPSNDKTKCQRDPATPCCVIIEWRHYLTLLSYESPAAKVFLIRQVRAELSRVITGYAHFLSPYVTTDVLEDTQGEMARTSCAARELYISMCHAFKASVVLTHKYFIRGSAKN